jgi:hypothetical protein
MADVVEPDHSQRAHMTWETMERLLASLPQPRIPTPTSLGDAVYLKAPVAWEPRRSEPVALKS